jgi:hypothetical protein
MNKTVVETLTKQTIFDKDGQVLALCETQSNGVKRVSLKQRDCINFSSIYFKDLDEVREVAKAMLEAVK